PEEPGPWTRRMLAEPPRQVPRQCRAPRARGALVDERRPSLSLPRVPHDEGRGELMVVDHDARPQPGLALARVDVLALTVSAMSRLFPGLRGVAQAMVSSPFHAQVDGIIPRRSELRAME